MFQFTDKILKSALSHQEFLDFTSSIFNQEIKPKPYDNDHYLNYTKSNFRWSKRMSKGFELTDDQKKTLQSLNKSMTWVLLNEPWCGDGAFTQALLNEIAAASKGKITLIILLRDSNLEVMQHYLTNGGMAIPKLVVLDDESKELTTWGPRPKKLQNQLEEWKKDPKFDNDSKIQSVYEWYIQDKNKSTQEEMFQIIQNYS